MEEYGQATLEGLLGGVLPHESVATLMSLVEVERPLRKQVGGVVHRTVLAASLCLLLFDDLLDRVPSATQYISDIRRVGGRITLDHGAVRTVDMPGMGHLPRGEDALTRVLIPLGYKCNEIYCLDALGMTGRSYTHLDLPEALPQFFVSELHVERFSPAFQAACERVTRSSRDPLSENDRDRLERLSQVASIDFAHGIALLPRLASCFRRQHDLPRIDDYETLLAESHEMAWIATEGNAFNHAADRVQRVVELAEAQREVGRPIKDAVEISASGRIRQTAYRADPISRQFLSREGMVVDRLVPGSFFEFIQRGTDPKTGHMDLSFDSGNAQGIFTMTRSGAA